MKCLHEKKNFCTKFYLLLLIILSVEVLSLNQNINSELERLKKREKYSNRSHLKRSQQMKDNKENTNKLNNEMNFRFKSTLALNLKDGEENTDVVTNSVITSDKKINPKPDDQEVEVVPNSAEAGSEFNWGFLLWSFMNFGAENAISGHSGYWLSNKNVVHDYWQAVFNKPQIIDTIQITWRLPPKRLKIFYKLDENTDWIGATEVFIKEDVKDLNGNLIPGDSSTNYNTVYFRKPLLCTRVKIMMNQPLRKKSFSIEKVNFFNKIGRGIIKAPLLNKKENFCWFINTNVIRKDVPIFVYPCIEAISIGIGMEIFQINTNKQIKPYNYDLCVGYSSKTKEVVLKECQEEGSGFLINYNSDTSMFFVGMQNTAISVDNAVKYPNFINEQTEINASSEADKLEFRKENMLTEGGSFWASEPGMKEVTVQILFGKIKCEDCKEDGAYESRKIDTITINWVREPKKFSVFLWNPGYSWKNISTFENNIDKVTQISLVNEIAAGLMIRMMEGSKFENLGNQVSYAIISVYASFRGHMLKIMPQGKKPMAMRFFDFESQSQLVKKDGNKLEDSMKQLGQNYEKAISSYRHLKTSVSALKQTKTQARDICKKLNMYNEICGPKGFDKLRKFEIDNLRKIDNIRFLNSLKRFGNENIINYLTGVEHDDSNSDYISGTPEEEDQLANKNFYKNPLSKIEDNKNYLKNVSGEIASKKSTVSTINSYSDSGSNSNSNGEDELYANKIFSHGTPSKPKTQRDDQFTTRELGSKSYPAGDCLQIKKGNPNALSGFYFIMPECSPLPIRVFCDFALFADAVDIYIFKDGSKLQTPDLSYLKIKTHDDVKAQCAKYGLYPIELKNKDTVTRIHQIIVATGMNLNYPNFVPLGYDYTCKFGKCSKIFNSLSNEKSFPIMNYFSEETLPFNSSKSKARTSAAFAGLGTSDSPNMVVFEPNLMTISALICSTNVFESRDAKKIIKQIDCEFILGNNLDFFGNSFENVFICSKNCQASPQEVVGSGTYHANSSICKAAIHSGAITGKGGKVTIRLQRAERNYVGSIQNGIKSLDFLGDGQGAFIVYKYIPNCPRASKSGPIAGSKPVSSFIEQAEKVELKKENESKSTIENNKDKSAPVAENKNINSNNITSSNKGNNNGNDMNNLHVKILLDSILSGINNTNNADKNSELSKKIMLLKELIPSAYTDAKQNQSSISNNNDEINKKMNPNNQAITDAKILASSKTTELDKVKTENLKANSEIYNQVRFFEKNQEQAKSGTNSESKSKLNSELNKSKEKINTKQIANGSGLPLLAANAASNLLGENINSPAVSSAANLANAFGNALNGGSNFLKGLFPGNSANGAPGVNSAPQVSNNNDALAAQNQAFAGQAQGDNADFNNPFSSGTSADDVGGRYSTPNSLMGNSISNPTNNPLMTGTNALNNQMSNVSKAGAAAQKYQDPNLALNGSFSSELENNSHPSNTPGSQPQTPVSVEGDLPGQKNSNSNINPNPFDLSRSSSNSSSGGNLNLIDPNDMKDDANPNGDLPGGPDDNGDSNDTSYQTGDVPGNHGFNNPFGSTEKAKSKLNRLANSSIGKDLNSISQKANKIDNAISQFVNNLNQACYGNANGNAINSEASADFNSPGSSGGSGKFGSSGNFNKSRSRNQMEIVSNQGSLGITGEEDSETCNIINAPALYNELAENEHKMDNFIKHLNRECEARIYKTKKIRDEWSEKLLQLTEQDPVDIDYSRYPDVITANREIFGGIFEVMSLGSDEIYKSTWGLFSRNLKNRKRALGLEFNRNNQNGFASSMILLRGKVYYDVTIKLDVMLANNGTVGIIFRAKDRYNFYAFIIDKTTGNKAIARVVNGEIDILKKISDGGILVNQWHSIKIEVRANKISVFIYDAEAVNKTITEKTIVLEDNTFVKGSVGIFTNGVKGFYFDNFSTVPITCWSPWTPKLNIIVRNSNSNFYMEDFRGALIDKYFIHDLEESDAMDGPSMWGMVKEFSEFGDYIEQTSAVYDKTAKKRTHFITLRNGNLQNGIFLLQFIPAAKKGIISVIFKYNEVYDARRTRDKTVEYYTFELNNETAEPSFTLKMYLNGESKMIQSINVSQISMLSHAYIAQRMNSVKIEVINERITIKISQDNREFLNVFNLSDNKIPYGSIGFGTYRTSARFLGIYINPPKLKMTTADIDYILNKNFVGVPFPSPWKIKEAISKSNSLKRLTETNTALGYLYQEISLLRSSLGFDFKNMIEAESFNDYSIEFASEYEQKEDFASKNLNGWRRCVIARNEVSRRNYCDNQFENQFMREKCQTDFCNTCCSENTDPKNMNILHMCKKSCYKSSLAVDSNNEYKLVCINSEDYQANIYQFCDRKMLNFNKKLLAFCKLDMCNLCCVGMDKIRNKNFSISNLQKCFNDCASQYNVSNVTDGNIVTDRHSSSFSQNDILTSENNEDFKELMEISSLNISTSVVDINEIIREGSVENPETPNPNSSADSNPTPEEIAKIIESNIDNESPKNLPQEVDSHINEKDESDKTNSNVE